MSTGVGLLGDVHGGAGQQCVEFLQRLVTSAEGGDLAEAVAAEVASYRERRAYVPGFGHRFHTRDPRRDPLLEAVQAAVDAGVVSGRYLAAALELEAQLSAGRARPVPMNIDGATAVIYAELGFTAENDPACRKIRQELTARLAAASATQRQQGRDFDREEFREGGNMHRLILGLVNGQ